VKKPEDKSKIEKALKKFDIYLDLAIEGNVQGKPYIIKDLLKMIQVLHDCALIPCKEMIILTKALIQVYDFTMNGNMNKIPQLRK